MQQLILICTRIHEAFCGLYPPTEPQNIEVKIDIPRELIVVTIEDALDFTAPFSSFEDGYLWFTPDDSTPTQCSIRLGVDFSGVVYAA